MFPRWKMSTRFWNVKRSMWKWFSRSCNFRWLKWRCKSYSGIWLKSNHLFWHFFVDTRLHFPQVFLHFFQTFFLEHFPFFFNLLHFFVLFLSLQLDARIKQSKINQGAVYKCFQFCHMTLHFPPKMFFKKIHNINEKLLISQVFHNQR